MSFAKSAHPMWVYDRETLAFLDVNEAAVRAYGYSRQQFLIMTILDIRPTEDVPAVLLQTRDRSQQKVQSTAEKWRHQTEYGTVFPVTITTWDLTFRGHPAELVLARRENAPDSGAAKPPGKSPF
jgi:PAS domain S-box-containing protein